MDCGNTILQRSGFLHSPNFPSQVTATQCQYVFNLESQQYLEIDFISLNMGTVTEEDSCDNSKLTVRGFNSSTELCGYLRPSMLAVVGEVTVTMYAETLPGIFLLSYEVKDCPGNQIFSNYPTACDKKCIDGEIIECTAVLSTPRCFCPSDRPFLSGDRCITYDECGRETAGVITTKHLLTTSPDEKQFKVITTDENIEGSVEATDVPVPTTKSEERTTIRFEEEISGEGSGITEEPKITTKAILTASVKITTDADVVLPNIGTTDIVKKTTQSPDASTETDSERTTLPKEDITETLTTAHVIKTTPHTVTTKLIGTTAEGTTQMPEEETTVAETTATPVLTTSILDGTTQKAKEETTVAGTTAQNELTTSPKETTSEKDSTTIVVTETPVEETTAISAETTKLDDETTLPEKTTQADVTTSEVGTTRIVIEESTIAEVKTTNPPVETTILEDTTTEQTTSVPKVYMPPVRLSLVNITDEKVCFSFVSNRDGSIYKIQISELDEDGAITFTITEALPSTIYRECVDELEPDTRYAVQVITADDYIISEWSKLEAVTRRKREVIVVQVMKTFSDGACIQISTAADGDVYRFSVSATNSTESPITMGVTSTDDTLLKCIQGLEADTHYTATVTSISGTVYTLPSSVAYFTTPEVPVKTEVVYEQTRELKEWRSTYLNWRSTFSNWITLFTKFSEKTHKSRVKDENFECPKQTQMPPCLEDPVMMKDRNDCILFLCMSPPVDDDFAQRDLIGWEEEYIIFRDYFLPQWESMFEEEMRLIEEEEKDA